MTSKRLPARRVLTSCLSGFLAGPGLPATADVLQPGETQDVTPHVLIAGMTDRVLQVEEYAELGVADTIARAGARQIRHDPVIRYEIRDAVVSRNGISSPVYRNASRQSLLRDLTRSRIAHLDRARSACTWAVANFFGHWIADGIPAGLIDADTGRDLFFPDIPGSQHCRSYREDLGIPAVAADVVFAESLVFYADHSQGSHKRARYEIIRDRLRKSFRGTAPGTCVYIRRGGTGARRLIVNEDEIVEKLASDGWTILDIAAASVSEIQGALVNSAVVAGIDGSHMCHAIFSVAPGGLLLDLVPSDRFSLTVCELGRANGLKTAIVVLNGSRDAGYTCSVDEISRTLDIALS